MTSNTHILVVDDAPDIRQPLGQYLRKNGHDVSLAADAQAARTLLSQDTFDAVILDIMMPGEDGLSLCRWVVEHKQIPVILLTAMATDLDKIVGLEIGADDYVVKPFNPRELLARLRIVLRRSRSDAAPEPTDIRTFGRWTHDASTGVLTDSSQTEVTLTASENRLLCALLDVPNTVRTRAELLEKVLRRDERAFERTIDNMIARLRKKIEENPTKPRLLLTDRGRGYRLAVSS